MAVDLEPAPYKSDLWNAFTRSDEYEIDVIYTRRRDWAEDGAHDYQKFPKEIYGQTTYAGGSVRNNLITISQVWKKLSAWQPDYVFVSGYVDCVPLSAILICILTRRRYLLHSDIFNCSSPRGRYRPIRRLARDVLRTLIFRTAYGVLVCGTQGRRSALACGCPEVKIIDFPYVIDIRRMLDDEPTDLPPGCKEDLVARKVVVLFSGRLIERKGLSTLLEAVSIVNICEYILWIEGGGPCFERYKAESEALGIKEKCRFLGFGQMDLHSWLVRNADIVVVPSLQDSWGIVVDEGMQHGKAVISSDAVGSGLERIVDGFNGLIYPRGDKVALSEHLLNTISDEGYRRRLGDEAKKNQGVYGPMYNLNNLSRFIAAELT